MVLAALVVVAIIVFWRRRSTARTRALAALAAARGLRFTVRDDGYRERFGGEEWAANILEGEHAGHPLVVFDSAFSEDDFAEDSPPLIEDVTVVAIGTGHALPSLRCEAMPRSAVFGSRADFHSGDRAFDKRFEVERKMAGTKKKSFERWVTRSLRRRQQEGEKARRRFDRERTLRGWGEWLALDVTRQALVPLASLLVIAVAAGWWWGSQQNCRQVIVAPGIQRLAP